MSMKAKIFFTLLIAHWYVGAMAFLWGLRPPDMPVVVLLGATSCGTLIFVGFLYEIWARE